MNERKLQVVEDHEDQAWARMYGERLKQESRERRQEARTEALLLAVTALLVVVALLLMGHFISGSD